MDMGEFSNSSSTRGGRGAGVSCEPGGDPKNVSSDSRDRSSDTGDLEDEDKIGSPIAARSIAEDKQYRPRNWDKTKRAKATIKRCYYCVLVFSFCTLFFVLVLLPVKPQKSRIKRTMILDVV